MIYKAGENMIKVKLGINDLATTHPELLKEWDYEKNDKCGILPTCITAGSNKTAFWKCSEGHEWSTRIFSRTKGSICPVCSKINKGRAIAGINDLATTHPELLKEWNYERNTALGFIANETFAKSSKKVWWKCAEGHEWEAVINNRANGNACPYCTGRKVKSGINDLATTYPELLTEWFFEGNNNSKIFPTDVSANSHKKVQWKCSKGHMWNARISDRTAGRNCPRCYIEHKQKAKKGINDLATQNPKLLKEWDYEKNDEIELKPNEISAGSHKKAFWKCSKGHTWKAVINSRKHGTGCPYCSGRLAIEGETDLATTNPELLEEWDFERNNQIGLNPNTITAGSSKRAFWICRQGHKWNAIINSRKHGTSCPYCNSSKIIESKNKFTQLTPNF